MRSILCVLLFRLLALPSSEDELRMEILALRHQIQVFKEGQPNPRLGIRFRIYWVLLSSWWSHWKSACVLVKPETVNRWHRASFGPDAARWSPRTRKRIRASARRAQGVCSAAVGSPRSVEIGIKQGFPPQRQDHAALRVRLDQPRLLPRFGRGQHAAVRRLAERPLGTDRRTVKP